MNLKNESSAFSRGHAQHQYWCWALNPVKRISAGALEKVLDKTNLITEKYHFKPDKD